MHGWWHSSARRRDPRENPGLITTSPTKILDMYGAIWGKKVSSCNLRCRLILGGRHSTARRQTPGKTLDQSPSCNIKKIHNKYGAIWGKILCLAAICAAGWFWVVTFNSNATRWPSMLGWWHWLMLGWWHSRSACSLCMLQFISLIRFSLYSTLRVVLERTICCIQRSWDEMCPSYRIQHIEEGRFWMRRIECSFNNLFTWHCSRLFLISSFWKLTLCCYRCCWVFAAYSTYCA